MQSIPMELKQKILPCGKCQTPTLAQLVLPCNHRQCVSCLQENWWYTNVQVEWSSSREWLPTAGKDSNCISLACKRSKPQVWCSVCCVFLDVSSSWMSLWSWIHTNAIQVDSAAFLIPKLETAKSSFICTFCHVHFPQIHTNHEAILHSLGCVSRFDALPCPGCKSKATHQDVTVLRHFKLHPYQETLLSLMLFVWRKHWQQGPCCAESTCQTCQQKHVPITRWKHHTLMHHAVDLQEVLFSQCRGLSNLQSKSHFASRCNKLVGILQQGLEDWQQLLQQEGIYRKYEIKHESGLRNAFPDSAIAFHRQLLDASYLIQTRLSRCCYMKPPQNWKKYLQKIQDRLNVLSQGEMELRRLMFQAGVRVG